MKSKNIVFVHGIFGWGKSEMVGLPYWGKALKLDSQGFTVHEASCGPVSSFHDRACEIAAQLRGVKVDYGQAHSEQAGHAQEILVFMISTWINGLVQISILI